MLVTLGKTKSAQCNRQIQVTWSMSKAGGKTHIPNYATDFYLPRLQVICLKFALTFTFEHCQVWNACIKDVKS